jgi:CubicO group peptidase (beta-lactamase class C family)
MMRVEATAFVALVCATSAFAAPDEAALGRDEGYPICVGSIRPEPRCLVGMVSRFDEVLPARVVAKGDRTRPLQHSSVEPAIRYSYQRQSGSVDDYLARNRATGLIILKGDTILVERYQYGRTPEHRMASFSMAKTIVAMLVGIALSEGSIRSLDDTAAEYVAELKGTPYGETRLRHLLTMSSGVRFVENYSGSDDVATLVRLSVLGESEGGAATLMPFRTRDLAPGERFSYSSAETQVLGLVVRAATGKPLALYASERIWQPMGAEADASWQVDKGGYEAAYFGFNATLRDFARLGMLLAHDGALGGRQIIPAAWVRAATTPSAKQFEPGRINGLFGYGYQTWLLPGNEREFVLRGLRGQSIFVAPKSGIVMVHTAAGNVSNASSGETVSLWFGVVKSLTGKRTQ